MSAAVVIILAILLTGTRPTGFVVVPLLGFDTNSRYYLGDLLYVRCTRVVLEVSGEVISPTLFPCVQSNFRIDGLSFCSVSRLLLLRVLT